MTEGPPSRRIDEQRYKRICDASPDAIFIVDTNGCITFTNQRVADHFGYTPDELIGENVELLLPPDIADEHVSLRSKYFESPKTRSMGLGLDLQARKKDGTTFPVDISLSPLNTDNGLEAIAVVRDITEHESLRRKHRSVLQAVPDPIFELDPATGIVLEATEQASELLGYDRDELVGREYVDLHPSDDVDLYRTLLDELVENGKTLTSTLPDGSDIIIQTKEGNRLPIEVNATLTTVESGQRVIAVIRDISKRKEQEDRLREAQQRQAAILDAVPVPLVIASLKTGEPVVQWVNAAFKRVFGLTEAELRGISIDQHIVTEHTSSEAVSINRKLAQGQPVTQEVQRKTADGEVRSFLLEATPLSLGDRNEAIGAYVDFTEQRRLLRKRKLLSSVTRSIGEAKTFEDGLTRVIRLVCEYSEWDYGEVWLPDNRQRLVFAAGFTEDPTIESFCEASQNFTMEIGEGLPGRVGSTGSSEWSVDVSSEPNTLFVRADLAKEVGLRTAFGIPISSEGEILAVLVFFCRVRREQDDYLLEDVTDVISNLDSLARQKRSETKLRRRNERLEQFSRVISHDIRNPLNVASGYLQLAKDDLSGEHLDVAANALDRLDELVGDLLEWARQGMLVDETEEVDLAESVNRCWYSVATGDATLEVDGTTSILADRSRFDQLMENLLRNAVQHGGEDVTIRIGSLHDGFFFEDDGPGIPSAIRDRVFEVGFSSEDDGTGFGLAIVYEIVEAHGWHVEVGPSREGGARFEITNVEIVSSYQQP